MNVSLTDMADVIVDKWNDANEEDIVDLWVILVKMARKYKDTLVLAAKEKKLYDDMRNKKEYELRQEWKSITEAKEMGRIYADLKYGDYEEMESVAKWMKIVIDCCNTFVSACQTKFRNLGNYVNSGMKDEKFNKENIYN